MSVSSKVIDLGVNQKPICDFLLVINCNFGRISYRFRAIDVYREWLVFCTMPCLTLQLWGYPLEFMDEIYSTETTGMGYRTVKIA